VLLAACSPASQTAQPPAATATVVGTQTPTSVNVYVGISGDASDNGAVVALSGTTGARLWNHTTGPVDSSTPVLDHGVAYVGTDTSILALSMQDGKQLWSYTTPNTTPQRGGTAVIGVANGLVFGMTIQDNPAIYALDASTGKARWTYKTSDMLEQAYLLDGVIYASTSQPNCHCSTPPITLLALNASTGSVKWKTAPSSEYFYIRQVANGLLYISHAVAEGPASDLQVRRASDGSVAWQFPKDGNTAFSLIAVDSTSVYALNDDLSNFPNPGASTLYALNATTGATRWQTPLSKTASFTGAVFNQLVYLESSEGPSLSAYSASDGKLLWKTAQAASVVSVGDGTIYLTTATGFAALKASDGSVIWQAPVPGFASLVAVQNGIVYGSSSSKDTSLSGHNGVFALKASDGSSLWSYPVPAIFSAPVVG
jgi:outer membrane protein assembly factor BamB